MGPETRMRWRGWLLCALLTLGAAPAVAASGSAGTLRVGVSGDYAPFVAAADTGEFTGLDIEIAKRLAQDLDMTVEFVRFAWPELATRIRHAEFDVAMSGVTALPDRAVIGRYTRPYAATGAVAAIRVEDAARFNSLDALDQPGVRIVVNAGGHLERVAKRLFRRASVRPVAENRSLLERVLAGNEDAAVVDSAEVHTALPRELRVIGPFTHDHKAFLLPVDRGALAVRINAWLAEREADGWLDTQRRRWLGDDAGMNAPAAGREAVAGLIRLRLDMMPAMARAKRAENRPLEDPEQESTVFQRVRTAAPHRPERVLTVYRVLIEMAKVAQVQQAYVTDTASVAQMRAAVARVDEILAAELDRGASGTLPEWRTVVTRAIDGLGFDGEALLRLAVVLALPERSASPAAESRTPNPQR